MKRTLFIAVAMLATWSAYAQQETLVNDGYDSGGYGAPVWKLTSVHGHAAVSV